jgi:threonylcarbamoyladenosine tRNA methylthiotransferase CDKAL1
VGADRGFCSAPLKSSHLVALLSPILGRAHDTLQTWFTNTLGGRLSNGRGGPFSDGRQYRCGTDKPNDFFAPEGLVTSLRKTRVSSMKKFVIRHFGCSRRELDAARIAAYFSANGLTRTDSVEDADYCVAITCGLTKDQSDRSIASIVDFQKNKGALLVYGCLPAMDPESVSKVYGRRTLLTKNIDHLDEFFDLPIKFRSIPDANTTLPPLLGEAGPEQRTTASSSVIVSDLPIRRGQPLVEGIPGGVGFNSEYFTIRIAEGCLSNCAYCSIKKAIGDTRSKSIATILTELQGALTQKQHQINIVSSDSGSYGLDIGSTLPELLRKILSQDSRLTVEFLQDFHPYWFCRYGDEMVEIAKGGRIKSVLTAIQSGNERILTLMKRHTDLVHFRTVLAKLKEACPAIRLRTQVIVGFVTETEREFDDTINFVQGSHFDEVDMFAYYEVKGSASEAISPKVPHEVIMARIDRMRAAMTIPFRVCL